jgi:WD40 repeat protein
MNVANAQLVWQLTLEGAWPTAVAFLSESRLAASDQLGRIFVWDLPASPPAGAVIEPGPLERTAADHPPGRWLIGHENSVTGLCPTPDGKQLISVSLDRAVRIWDSDVSAGGTAEVILDLETRKFEARRTGSEEGLRAPGVVVETLAAQAALVGHEDWILSLAISRDGRRLITGDAAARVIVWDMDERREVARWSGYPWNWIVGCALSADGQTALVSEHRYKRDDFDLPAPAVRLFTAEGREKLDILKAHFESYDPIATSYGSAQVWGGFVAQGLIAVDFSPDGTLVALGQGGETEMGKVHLVETATGKLVRDVSGHQYGITAVKFSADGQYVLSTGRDTQLRICRVSDGAEVAALGQGRGGQFKDWLSALALSPDETHVAATDIAGLVHVWRLA